MKSTYLSADGYTVLRPFRHGRAQMLLCLREDYYIGRTVELFGEYSEAEVDVFRKFIRSDDIVIDAGALFGEHTLAMAELCPDGSVLAFEPQRIPFQILCGNLQINSMQNVDCSKAALGAVDGVASVPSLDPASPNPWGLTTLQPPVPKLYLPLTRSCMLPNEPTFAMVPEGHQRDGGRISEAHRTGDMVRVRTIDSLFLGRLDFVKIDVEGFEPWVLAGGMSTILKCRPVLYIEFNTNRDRILSELADLKYERIWRHLAPVYRYPNFNGKPTSDADVGEPPRPSDMLLAVPNERYSNMLTDLDWLSRAGFGLLLEGDERGT